LSYNEYIPIIPVYCPITNTFPSFQYITLNVSLQHSPLAAATQVSAFTRSFNTREKQRAAAHNPFYIKNVKKQPPSVIHSVYYYRKRNIFVFVHLSCLPANSVSTSISKSRGFLSFFFTRITPLITSPLHTVNGSSK